MNTEQLPAEIREFADYLSGLLARLNPYEGWYGVFRERDPDGLRACASGAEMPPWDVVESLLQDLTAQHGTGTAEAEQRRARDLHTAGAAAYDARPGGREALGSRLEFMAAEQRRAAARLRELRRRSPRTPEEAQELEHDLAWTEDDHLRARARCGELQARLAELHRREGARQPWPEDGEPGARERESGSTAAETGLVPEQRGAMDDAVGGPAGHGPGGAPGAAARPRGTGGAAGEWTTGQAGDRQDPAEVFAEHGLADADPAEAGARPGAERERPAETSGSWLRLRRRSRGGARYGGGGGESRESASAAPDSPAGEPAGTGRGLTGARFAGGAAQAPDAVRVPDGVQTVAPAEPDPAAEREIAAMVDELLRLRAEGRTGEAHSLLAEAAQWPEPRFPRIAVALSRAGLRTDWDTLLWEASSLPTARLVAVANALTAARHESASTQLLRQAAARPAAEVGEAVLDLVTAGRDTEARSVLDTFLRARSAQDAAELARVAPRRLVPLLRRSAKNVSAECAADLGHALRVAGLRG